jgi:uncharacterized membrane protein
MRTRHFLTKIVPAAALAGLVPAGLRWVKRAGAARRVVDLRMTVVVERPIADVFEFCRDFENFPEIVDVLLSVEDSQDGRSHWAVRSPLGEAIQWDAVVTKYVPNSVIAWQSVPQSEVEARGMMRFAPLSPEETRVDISLAYRPVHTRLREALKAMVRPRNNTRLRSELSKASREMVHEMEPAEPAEAVTPASNDGTAPEPESVPAGRGRESIV